MDIIVEKDDNKGGNGFNLAPEKRSKICQQIGKSIFLIEQSNFKVNDVLKTPVAIRSYREVNVFSAFALTLSNTLATIFNAFCTKSMV